MTNNVNTMGECTELLELAWEKITKGLKSPGSYEYEEAIEATVKLKDQIGRLIKIEESKKQRLLHESIN